MLGGLKFDYHKKAIFAGGCFWCMVKPFNKYDGVLEENHSLKKTGKFLSKRKRS